MSLTFTKLFSSITESTIWFESHATRIVWITMLAMSDRNGLVFGSVPGLAHRARVSLEECRSALGTLLSPDPDSRTKEHEGVRIAEVDGGWELLNHAKYRAVQDAEAIRLSKRDYMRRQRESGTAIPQWKTPSGSDSGSDLRSREGDAGETIKVNPQKGNTAPDSLVPTETQRVRCQELRMDVEALMRAFKLQEFNRDYSDWPRRFSKWIEDQKVKNETDAHRANVSKVHSYGKAPAVMEPSDQCMRYAKKHGVPLAQLMGELVSQGVVDSLGAKGATEELEKRVKKYARERRAS